MILFVTGTGTGIGKTALTTALTQHLVFIGVSAVAVKPLETGCEPDPLDALALASASNRPRLSSHPSFYRVPPPLSPYAATLSGESPPDFDGIVHTCQALAAQAEVLIVEGAGGLMVPLDQTRSMADLALALGATLLMVAPDRLGVLSDVISTVECAQRRQLPIAAIVLNRGACPPDPSRTHNATIVQERCQVPVVTIDTIDPANPTRAILDSGLLSHLALSR